ncbi:MAG TPA: hypothetical protein VGT61_06680 [Thermomicrobiales bacterium]|jgi:catechol 2,3-dioxygenase-like lactoylglutathione lyase family enzyme|nr:hypothetical protein [Thermomicrobiales bacterium]
MRPRPCDVGSAHFAFEVDDMEAVVERSGANGWKLLGTIETWPEGPMTGTRLAYITNDDGTILEFYQLPGSRTGS